MGAPGKIVKRSIVKSVIILSLAFITAVILGIILSNINNMGKIEELLDSRRPSLPTILLDRNGKVITEFYSDEKRDMVSLDLVPEFMVQSLILWEDESFYQHHGFNPLAILRAAINNVLGFPVSGASTLTQQLSRTIFLNNEFSFKRKIKELWISFQLEKKYTKNELLTLYLNHVPFGYGINGVQAASKFFFNKDVKDISYAEAASLVTVISNPTFYSFIRFPKNHKKKQKEVLNKMVKSGVITKAQADSSFNEFWVNWQTSTFSSQGAFYNREDKAPFFSSWILQVMEKELPSANLFKDGLTIHTTLDLDDNMYVESIMKTILDKQQKIFEEDQAKNFNIIQNYYVDAISLMSQAFSLSSVNIGKDSIMRRSITKYQNNINPGFNLTAKLLGIELVDTVTENAFTLNEATQKISEDVQGAFLSIDNATGQILTMIGGKYFDVNNRFNYAMQGRRQPGSSFKPFVYSAALDTGIFTAASVFNDEETVFTFDSEDPDDWYKPYNYGGIFYGKVSLRRALRRSLNIPAVKIFYEIGKDNNYKVPLDRAALLLGINSQKEIDNRFGREISTVLGTGSVSLAEMVTGYSVFANMGQKKTLNCILSVEDRDGKIILEPYKEIDRYYKENKKRLQIISPQNAYIMTDILKGTVHSNDGFLYGTKMRLIAEGKPFPDIELAAKTGTTQNWSDGWILGYSPDITAGAWMGFKEYGLSLGYGQDGSIILGNIWVDYMRKAHLGKQKIYFKDPGGIYRVKVCKESGKLPSPDCHEDGLYYEMFLPGTVPKEICDVCSSQKELKEDSLKNFTSTLGTTKTEGFGFSNNMDVDTSMLTNEDNKDELFNDDETFNYSDNDTTGDRTGD